MFADKDSVIRALKAGTGFLEREVFVIQKCQNNGG